ncbi:hypothetical protein [Paraburkholderia sp. 40]|uniref:hypothetical protein n=1 Tax=Paraburkholderia sp. 40 TaxID=2991059 RepID=UPI003D1AFA29
MTSTLARHALKRLREIGAMAAEGESDHLPANATDRTARRRAAIERLRTISQDRVARASAVVPRAEREAVPGYDGGMEELGISSA